MCLGVGRGPLLGFLRTQLAIQVVYVEVDEEVLRTSSQYYGLEDFENIDVQVGDAIKVLEKLSPLANGHHLSSFAAHRVDDGSGVDGHSDIDIKLDVIMVVLDSSDARDGLIDPPLEFDE